MSFGFINSFFSTLEIDFTSNFQVKKITKILAEEKIPENKKKSREDRGIISVMSQHAAHVHRRVELYSCAPSSSGWRMGTTVVAVLFEKGYRKSTRNILVTKVYKWN